MAAVTSLGSTFDTLDGTKLVLATPAVGDLIVIVTGQTDSATDTAPTDNNTDGLGAYTAIQNRSKASGTVRLGIYVRNALIGSGTLTTFTHAPGTTSGGGLYVLKVTGMSRSGSSAVRGSGGQDQQASSTTPAPVLTQAGLTTNPVITAVVNGTNPAGVTIPTSFTDQGNLGYIVPTTGIRTASRDSGNTSQAITWGGTSASTYASAATELDISTLAQGAAALSGTGSLSAEGVRVVDGASALTATGSLSSAGVRTAESTAALAGVGSLTADGVRLVDGTAALSGTGSAQATGEVLIQGAVALTGVGSASVFVWIPTPRRSTTTTLRRG